MWSWNESGDERRREYLMEAAGDAHPFIEIIHRFYSRKVSEETLDEIALAIEESPLVQDFKTTLDNEEPSYTSIFRYDPSSITFLGQDGCFSSRSSMGANIGYGRIFEGLRSNDIYTLRTSDEVMVVIKKPSYVIDGSTYEKPYDTNDPTVLFTSKMFQHDGWLSGRDTAEEHQTGMVVKHAERPIELLPEFGLTSNAISDGYIKYVKRQMKAAQPETA